jgi:hypothetical protein
MTRFFSNSPLIHGSLGYYPDENGEEAIECLPCRRCREGGSIIRLSATLHRRGGHTTLK